jgi:hypothetical protein
MKARTAILLLPVALIIFAIVAPSVNHTLVNACVAASIAWLYWLTERAKDQANVLVDRLIAHNQELVRRAVNLSRKSMPSMPEESHISNSEIPRGPLRPEHGISTHQTRASVKANFPAES